MCCFTFLDFFYFSQKNGRNNAKPKLKIFYLFGKKKETYFHKNPHTLTKKYQTFQR